MAHLWICTQDGWAAAPLEASRYALEGAAPGLRREAGPAPVLLRRGADRAWAVLCAAGAAVRVNGLRVAGVRGLRDRDEIRVAGGPRCYFTTKRRAAPESMPEAPGEVRCARCQRVVKPGARAVRCPACDLWHHAADPPCWTYGPVCAGCEHPTAESGGLRWTPEGL